MLRLLIIGNENKALISLKTELEKSDFVCSIVPFNKNIDESLISQSPDLLLFELGAGSSATEIMEFIRQEKHEHSLPVIALISGEMPRNFVEFIEIDDFITGPYDARELAVRTQRLIRSGKSKGSETIQCDGLVIDLTNCDVTVNGRVVELTFKEYELLKLLAANRGRVYTREDLLNKIWGYEYFGGDRTVDVHIRRLRSKIESSTEEFIETVRNIGYRFKK
jgi:two-component system alkaline phosphatase synthesis response regulator PhoP